MKVDPDHRTYHSQGLEYKDIQHKRNRNILPIFTKKKWANPKMIQMLELSDLNFKAKR